MTQASTLGYFSTSISVLVSPDWVNTGLELFSNCCNPFRVSSEFGLLIRWFGVRVPSHPSSQTSYYPRQNKLLDLLVVKPAQITSGLQQIEHYCVISSS
jgi:hypothetical protein